MSDMSPLTEDQPEPPKLRFLRRLVVVLTATMIVGLLTIMVLIVMTLMRKPAVTPDMAKTIAIPSGETAQAFTQGSSWAAVVTKDEGGTERIHIFDPSSGEIRQTVDIVAE